MTFWCDDRIHVHIEGPEGPRDVVVDQPYAHVGYNPRAEVVLEGSGVRKRALFLLATKIGVYALNLDRQEAPLDEPGRWITSAEPIAVGPYQLTISLASGKLATPGLPGLADARAALPIPVLHIFGGGVLKDRRRLRHPLCLVGRRPQCFLQLRGEQVSSYHAALYWQDHRLWCLDLMSGNGTLLNGEAVVCSEVKLNDRLEVGEFGLLYYRWSPRHTTPGMEHMPEEEEEGAIWESAQAETRAASHVGSASKADETQLREQLADEFEERLAGERQAFEAAQAAWENERAGLRAELERMKADLEELSAASELESERQGVQTRQAFEAAQAAWENERAGLRAELERMKADLEELSAVTELAAEQQVAEMRQADASEAVPAPHFDIQTGPEEAESGIAGEADAPAPTFQQPAPSEPVPASSADVAAAADVQEIAVIAVKPTTRRRTQPRGELTSFVSGRLSDLEQAHRRRLWLIWAAAVVSALAIAGVGLGLWAWIA
jgi:hypothetical protein